MEASFGNLSLELKSSKDGIKQRGLLKRSALNTTYIPNGKLPIEPIRGRFNPNPESLVLKPNISMASMHQIVSSDKTWLKDVSNGFGENVAQLFIESIGNKELMDELSNFLRYLFQKLYMLQHLTQLY